MSIRRIALLLLLCLCWEAPTALADITTGLVLYWPLNDGSGATTADASGNGNTGTLGTGGAAPTWASGGTCQFSGCLTFDGTSDTLKTTSTLDLSGTSALTVAFWFYTTSFTTATTVFFEVGTSSDNDSFAMYFHDTGICGASGLEITLNRATYNTFCFDAPSTSTWHHYILALDPSATINNEVALYIDGTLQTLVTHPLANDLAGNFTNDTLHLMSRTESTLFTAGRLQEFRVYARILTSGDRTELLAFTGGGGSLARYRRRIQ